MRHAGRSFALVLLTVAAAGACLSHATLLVPMDIEQMTDRAGWIGLGTCTEKRSYWQGKQIWTDLSFRPERALKGEGGGEIRIRQLGGRVEKPVPLVMGVAGAPEFEVGETSLLFLERSPDGTHRVVGLSQGRIPLRRGASGEWLAGDGARLEALVSRIEARLKATGR